MKRGLAALLLLMGVGMMSANAAAQTTMNVFFTERAMERGQSRTLMELTRREFPQVEWTCEMQADTGRSLREMILADDVPEIVICAPSEAYVWAKEGVFEAMDAYEHPLEQPTKRCTRLMFRLFCVSTTALE